MENQENINQLDIKKIVRELWRNRFIFLISITIALIFCYFYVKFVSETYEVRSSILIKTKRDYASTSSNEYMNVYDLMGREVNMSNEINVLQSTPLIEEVLKDLNMGVSYYLQEDRLPKQFQFSLKDIYNESPFMIVFDQDHIQPLNTLFYINIINDEEFNISCNQENVWLYDFGNEEFHRYIDEINIGGKYKFGDFIKSDFFSFKILLNSNFEPDRYINKDLFFQFNSYHTMALAYQKSLDIESSFGGSTAEIHFIGNNLQKSLDFVNGLINKYIEKNLQEKTYLATMTIEYIDRQLTNVSDTLSKTEQQLQNFRRTYNVVDVNEKYNRIYTQLDNLEGEKDETNKRLNLLQQLKAYFDSNKDKTSTIVIPSTLGIEDPILNNLIEELIKLNTEKEQLIQNNQLQSPRLQIVNASINNLLNSVSENIDFALNTTSNDLQEINNRIAELNDEFSRLPQTQRRLLGIERQFNLTQDVYTSLMEKRIQAQIARSSTLPDCEIIEPAQYVEIASPNKIKSLAVALFCGLFFPSLFVLGKIFLSDKIKEKEELKRICKLTQIGELPEYKKVPENVLLNAPTEILAEAFRSLRSNTDFFLMGEKHKIVLVTSSIPKEGKSFSALNLATAFALTNRKTLLLRLDLRKTSEVYENFKEHELVGISDYLIRQANLEDIITGTEIPDLDIITSGKTPPNPVELLTSERMKDLLLQVKQKYDYVIADTPPFGLVSDAFILMKYADINIYLARLDIITKRTLIPSMEEISSKKIENIYMLINGLKPLGSGYAKYSKYPYGKKKTKSKKQKLKRSRNESLNIGF